MIPQFMRMHYVPRLLLRQFADEGGLWELDITTGVCERRNVDNACQHRHLYTKALETGFLSTIDGEADQILKARVYGRESISLTMAERQRLAEWLSTLVHRNPKKSEDTKQFIAKALSDPHSLLERGVDYAAEYVTTFKRLHPIEWAKAIANVEAGAAGELAAAITTLGAEEVLTEAVKMDINEQLRTGDFKGDRAI
jgi:hypothetical protein